MQPDCTRQPGAPRGAGRQGATKLIGDSRSMQRLVHEIGRAAPTRLTVLLHGETGTGKEVVARTLHDGSRRRGPFVPLNCAAIPDALVESELFGHDKGAFTGADERRTGAFEAAHTGTLFLDEIGDMPRSLQAKLLRVLQDQTVTPVGGRRAVPVDVRVIAATHQPLHELVRRGAFREDLYYRLAVLELTIPPLRDRREDIPFLLNHFLDRYCRECGRSCPTLTRAAIQRLQAHPWPGNVRQLENYVRRLVALLPEQIREVDAECAERQLEQPCPHEGALADVSVSFDFWRARSDLRYAAAQVQRCGSKKAAAEAMGFSREGLSKLCQRHFANFPELRDDPAFAIL